MTSPGGHTVTRFDIGSIVRARGREWVVLPETAVEDDLLVVRPLGGGDDEVTGIYLPLEPVTAARFPLPDPRADLGNHLAATLLRDATRLGLRSGAGPFRALGRIAVDPRPYQIVPLLMALRLDPVRLLLADDVGVGKTVEALLIARELFDRGDVQRLAVLCPPHLAGQWHDALTLQFGLPATQVLASTASALERDLGPGQSLFETHPVTVVSLDYIKSERRRDTFLRAAPELVIVDEAHGSADDGAPGRTASQQRHRLLKELAADATRQLVLVTATPHSGKQAAFRSLLGLLDPTFLDLPEDLSGDKNRAHRERLARHFVQRRRADVETYLREEARTTTTFPKRTTAESTYRLDGTAYQSFFERILAFCQERIQVGDSDVRRQRVRWWSALALLRAVGSSPAAGAATLRSRARSDSAESAEQVDAVGRQTVLDLDDEAPDGADVVHGADLSDASSSDAVTKRKLAELAALADTLRGDNDPKLQLAIAELKKLLKAGFSPIVFCRFIDTAKYLADELRSALGKKVTVIAVTGEDPPDARRQRVLELASEPQRVLVATDCLSEGINLQDAFDAVVHYDLSWNPTRHEQREGRVDRFGQPRPVVRALTLHGADNKIDRIVRKKLIEKHEAIKKQTGVSIPVPREGDTLVAELVGELLLRPKAAAARATQLTFDLGAPTHPGQLAFDAALDETTDLDRLWQAAADREKVSRSLFAQHGLKADEVWAQVRAARDALGGEADVRRFVHLATQALGGHVVATEQRLGLTFDVVPGPLADVVPDSKRITFLAGPDLSEGVATATKGDLPARLVRAHPFVAALSELVLAGALGPAWPDAPARRAAVIRTAAVPLRTVAYLLRLRFRMHLRADRVEAARELLAEDVALVAFRQGSAIDPGALASATPDANVPADVARAQLERALADLSTLEPALADLARDRARVLAAAHDGVRAVGKKKVTAATRVEPYLPPDILGVFVYLPVLAAPAEATR
ncbi:MAG: DEAD/DEAH box helicase [Deltaproteobacteria bacterium]|nr:DEAD/DEAH box helicase [Deltaproteobacteria bacterium]